MSAIANGWWLAAAFFSLVTALAHIFVGGRQIAAPLLAARTLHPIVRYTHYYCWHLVTIVLLALVLAFAGAGAGRLAGDLAIAATVFAVLATVWSLALVTMMGMSFRLMPQWALFVPVALCGLAGWAL
ncbi:MAG TPA: hypothetical protein PLG99_10675 [Kaistiaceae bacterium]|nr:hypothetical protein [Kaistiaceae bacterium]